MRAAPITVNKLPITHGWRWFLRAVNLGARDGRAIFGAAVLAIFSLCVVLFVAALPAAWLLKTGSAAIESVVEWLAPVFLLMVFLFPVLLGGLMYVIRQSEQARGGRALDVFAPLRAGRGWRLAAIGVVQLVFALLGAVLVMALAGTDYWHDYLAAVQAAVGGAVPVMPTPAHPTLLLVAQVFFNYLSYSVTLFSIPLVLFSDLPVVEAVKASLRAAVHNVGANLFAALLFGVGALLAGVITVLIAGFFTLLGGLLHPALGALLGQAVGLLYAATVLVVLAGCAYAAWDDTFRAARSLSGIEA